MSLEYERRPVRELKDRAMLSLKKMTTSSPARQVEAVNDRLCSARLGEPCVTPSVKIQFVFGQEGGCFLSAKNKHFVAKEY